MIDDDAQVFLSLCTDRHVRPGEVKSDSLAERRYRNRPVRRLPCGFVCSLAQVARVDVRPEMPLQVPTVKSSLHYPHGGRDAVVSCQRVRPVERLLKQHLGQQEHVVPLPDVRSCRTDVFAHHQSRLVVDVHGVGVYGPCMMLVARQAVGSVCVVPEVLEDVGRVGLSLLMQPELLCADAVELQKSSVRVRFGCRERRGRRSVHRWRCGNVHCLRRERVLPGLVPCTRLPTYVDVTLSFSPHEVRDETVDVVAGDLAADPPG